MIPFVPLAASFQSSWPGSSHKLMATHFKKKIHELFKTSMKKSASNVNLINLGNELQRNLRTGRTWECSFRASRGTNFEKFPAMYQFAPKNSGYITV